MTFGQNTPRHPQSQMFYDCQVSIEDTSRYTDRTESLVGSCCLDQRWSNVVGQFTTRRDLPGYSMGLQARSAVAVGHADAPRRDDSTENVNQRSLYRDAGGPSMLVGGLETADWRVLRGVDIDSGRRILPPRPAHRGPGSSRFNPDAQIRGSE